MGSILTLLQLYAALEPIVAGALPAIQAVIGGSPTQAQIDEVDAVTASLTARAIAAETAAGAT